MCIHHSCLNAFMPQQLLDWPYVAGFHHQVTCKCVPPRVLARVLDCQFPQQSPEPGLQGVDVQFLSVRLGEHPPGYSRHVGQQVNQRPVHGDGPLLHSLGAPEFLLESLQCDFSFVDDLRGQDLGLLLVLPQAFPYALFFLHVGDIPGVSSFVEFSHCHPRSGSFPPCLI